MTGWIFLGVWVAGFFWLYPKVYLAIMKSFGPPADYDSAGSRQADRVGAAVIAMLICGFFWPLVLAGYPVYRYLTPKTDGERKAELDERERHIKDLERELGVGQPSEQERVRRYWQ